MDGWMEWVEYVILFFFPPSSFYLLACLPFAVSFRLFMYLTCLFPYQRNHFLSSCLLALRVFFFHDFLDSAIAIAMLLRLSICLVLLSISCFMHARMYYFQFLSGSGVITAVCCCCL